MSEDEPFLTNMGDCAAFYVIANARSVSHPRKCIMFTRAIDTREFKGNSRVCRRIREFVGADLAHLTSPSIKLKKSKRNLQQEQKHVLAWGPQTGGTWQLQLHQSLITSELQFFQRLGTYDWSRSECLGWTRAFRNLYWVHFSRQVCN